MLTILAHQGGWDEALMVLVPIGLFIGVLAVANRRAKKMQAERDGNPANSAETGTGD
jgi:hypothetical protein